MLQPQPPFADGVKNHLSAHGIGDVGGGQVDHQQSLTVDDLGFVGMHFKVAFGEPSCKLRLYGCGFSFCSTMYQPSSHAGHFSPACSQIRT